MIEKADQAHPHEIGSSLVGHYSDDGFDATAKDIAPIPEDSMTGPTQFFRGIKGIAAYYRKLLQRSGTRVYYVGEWHTHPGGKSFPSSVDDKNQLAVSTDECTNCPESILIILGGSPGASRSCGLYVYSRKNGRIELVPVG